MGIDAHVVWSEQKIQMFSSGLKTSLYRICSSTNTYFIDWISMMNEPILTQAINRYQSRCITRWQTRNDDFDASKLKMRRIISKWKQMMPAWCIWLVLFCVFLFSTLAGVNNCCWCALTTAPYANTYFSYFISCHNIYNFERDTSVDGHRWTAFRLSPHRWLLLSFFLPAAAPLPRLIKFLFCLRFLLSHIPSPPSNCSYLCLVVLIDNDRNDDIRKAN